VDLRVIYLFAVLVFLLFLGCVGLKEPSDCKKADLRDSEKVSCLHQLAVSEAYREHPEEASGYCAQIWTEVGANHIRPENGKMDDVAIRAESERSLCYVDIAKIIARQTAVQTPGGGTRDLSSFAMEQCENIQQSSYSTELAGAEVTKEMCVKDVERLSKIRPENYYRNPDNICSVVFVLPLILVAVFLKKD